MKIKIPKEFFNKLKWKVKIPTIKCKQCGEDILDTPTNRLNNMIKIVPPTSDIFINNMIF